MRKTLAAALALSLMSCSRSHDSSTNLDLSTNEDVSTRSYSSMQDDPAGGTGAAMALHEGKMGKQDVARRQAIEQARTAGVLGSTELSSGFDSLTNSGGMKDRDRAEGHYVGGEGHHDYGKNPWVDARKDHLSTFAADVDTASYTLARRKILDGEMPVPAGVRVEEFVNYFHYAMPAPSNDSPFGVAMDAVASPFDADHYMLRVGVATRAKTPEDRKPAHLVFLVDVSGSMEPSDRLPLAKRALHILTDNLGERDTVAIVTYAGDSRLVLPVTSADHKDRIYAAIDELQTGGGTAMESGIDLAYTQAMKGIEPGVVSRVIVCTDGDANIGSQTPAELLKLIAGRAKEGVTLSTIGFGVGNYQDEMMEQLADKGNGNNFYIDSISQAHRVFEEQIGSTLEVVAKDTKLQVDFDPKLVSHYRLVGYENRDIADADFRNDRVDAGEVGAGHQVTALYELELTDKGKHAERGLATLRVRYKAPDGEKATERTFAMTTAVQKFDDAPADARFATAVAGFADILRGNKAWKLETVRAIANDAAGKDKDRAELVELIDKAIALAGRS